MEVPTFEGDEDAGRGQRLVGRRVPESEAGQCQEGVDRPQTVQLHGGPTSSNSQGVFKGKQNKKQTLQGQREEDALSDSTCHKYVSRFM